jgi:UDP-MurNAc hydroxylase
VRVTGVGHAGIFVETAAGSVLCDPWVSPAYFSSWFPFPDNSELDWDTYGKADYLYVSHLHKDHFDPVHLRRYISRKATVLLPEYPTEELHDALVDLGFTSFVHTRSGVPVEIDGLRLMILSLVSPTDGPIGDSALALDDGEQRLFNMNDARPGELDEVLAFGPYDAHLLQFSGAIWWPVVYELPDAAKAAFGRQKRERGMDRAVRYIEAVKARYVFPTAGPPCFLDGDLRHLNDLDRDESNIFPDQTVFLEYMADRGIDGGRLLLPGSVATVTDDDCKVSHPIDPSEVFEDKAAYLDAYGERKRPELEAERRSWGVPGLDVVAELKRWWEPLLAEADHICKGVGGPVRLEVGDLAVVIDFPAREVRRWDGEACRYWFRIAAPLVEQCIADRENDWVNSLFLSCRFSAGRIGPYNEYLYTFFKCLSEERINYAEGWYDEQDPEAEDITLDGWRVQRRCPHLKADLSRFARIDDGVLTCQMHGWRFELETGNCLTADGYPLRSRPAG